MIWLVLTTLLVDASIGLKRIDVQDGLLKDQQVGSQDKKDVDVSPKQVESVDMKREVKMSSWNDIQLRPPLPPWNDNRQRPWDDKQNRPWDDNQQRPWDDKQIRPWDDKQNRPWDDNQQRPWNDKQRPWDDNQQPWNNNQRPWDEHQQRPWNDKQRPWDDNQQPWNNNQRPWDEHQQRPWNDNQQPWNNNQRPWDEHQQRPWNDDQRPWNEHLQRPWNDDQRPWDEHLQRPWNDDQRPWDEHLQRPWNDKQRPWDDNQQPWNNNQQPWDDNQQRPWDDNQQPWDNNQQPWDDNQWDNDQTSWDDNQVSWDNNPIDPWGKPDKNLPGLSPPWDKNQPGLPPPPWFDNLPGPPSPTWNNGQSPEYIRRLKNLLLVWDYGEKQLRDLLSRAQASIQKDTKDDDTRSVGVMYAVAKLALNLAKDCSPLQYVRSYRQTVSSQLYQVYRNPQVAIDLVSKLLETVSRNIQQIRALVYSEDALCKKCGCQSPPPDYDQLDNERKLLIALGKMGQAVITSWDLKKAIKDNRVVDYMLNDQQAQSKMYPLTAKVARVLQLLSRKGHCKLHDLVPWLNNEKLNNKKESSDIHDNSSSLEDTLVA